MVFSIYKKIVKKIKEYDEIVIAHHIGPDPDAVASSIALKELIEYNFPGKKVYAVGANVVRFKYIGVLDKLNEDLNNALLIITDVPKFDRVDGINNEKFAYSIKIDHHPCEDVVCDLEVVKTVSSACELVCELAFSTKLKMNKSIASKLFIGMIADSDRFLLSYTTPETLSYCAKLLKDYDLDLMPLYNKLYERPLNERKFESYLINNITITENGFGYLQITDEVINKYSVDPGSASNMVNDLNFIKELNAWAFSTYDAKLGLYKINIRSRNVTINEVAEKFNGGGHKFASGARLKTKEEVNELFKALDQECKKYLEDNSDNV